MSESKEERLKAAASLRARAERAEAALSHVVNHCDCVTISPKCGCSTIIQARARYEAERKVRAIEGEP